VLAVDRAGLVGDDGETHQGVYDAAFFHHAEHDDLFARHAAELVHMLSLPFSR
jgi:deoxyxylulose-5-phosphate synthase